MYDKILKEEKKVIVKNAAPFDVERAGRIFKAGKERFVYFSQKLDREISACSHLVIITNRHILDKQIEDKTSGKIFTPGEYLKHPKVSIVILVKDALYYVKKCLKSLKTYTDNYELIIVDNDSKEKTKKYLKSIDWLDFTLITNKENKGVSYGWNQAIKIAKYDYVCLLNSDTMLSPNWLGKLMRGFNFHKNVGIVGPTSSRTGTLQSSPITRSKQHIEDQNIINKFAESLNEGYREIPIVGYCWVIKKTVFDKIGVFDWRRYGIAWHEDTDFSWRARKVGFKSVWCYGSYVHHFGAKTTIEMGIDANKFKVINRKILIERKKDPNLYIKNDVELGVIKKINININKSKKIVITANIGKYDNLIEQHYFNPNYKFVMFTEDKNIKSSLWKIRYIKPDFEDPRRESRTYKWLVHRFFPNAEYSLWIDSNIIIRTDINTLIERYLNNADIAMHIHGARNCIYKEAEVCIQHKLDYVDIIKKQMEKYRSEGYPENNGLHEGIIILRRHTKNIEKLNEAVWANICSGSTRDQLSLDYIAWKLDIKINTLPGKFISYKNDKNLCFSKVPHKSNKRQYFNK